MSKNCNGCHKFLPENLYTTLKHKRCKKCCEANVKAKTRKRKRQKDLKKPMAEIDKENLIIKLQ